MENSHKFNKLNSNMVNHNSKTSTKTLILVEDDSHQGPNNISRANQFRNQHEHRNSPNKHSSPIICSTSKKRKKTIIEERWEAFNCDMSSLSSNSNDSIANSPAKKIKSNFSNDSISTNNNNSCIMLINDKSMMHT